MKYKLAMTSHFICQVMIQSFKPMIAQLLVFVRYVINQQTIRDMIS